MLDRLRCIHAVCSFNTVHFLRPYWSEREWEIVFDELLNRREPGSAVEPLTQRMKTLLGVEYVLPLNSGRSAIQLALESYRFPPGREVIMPSFCCAAVIAAVIQAGLEPVLADVDDDFNLSATSVEEGLSPRTCAIIVPHLSGKWAESMDDILAIARHHNLKVIDDACPAFGLRRRGRWAGTFGDVGVFSFGAGKLLFGPGGGLLVTNDPHVIASCQRRTLPDEAAWAVRVRAGRFVWRYGWQRWTAPMTACLDLLHHRIMQPLIRSGHRVPGVHVCRMAEVDVRLALEQVMKCEEILTRFRENAIRLLSTAALQRSGFHLPRLTDHVFNKLLVCVTGANQQRWTQFLRQQLFCEGIETEPSYKPLHLYPAFARYRHLPVPITERRWQGAFSIPNNPGLTEAELLRLESVLERVLRPASGLKASSKPVLVNP